MFVWDLSEASISSLRQLPETGMGFQWVLARSRGDAARFLVFNSQYAYDLSDLEFLQGDDPSTILTNGHRVLQALQEQRASIIGRPEPSEFLILANRVETAALSAAASLVTTVPQIVQPSSLVKKLTLTGRRVFHRYSAFNPDRRVDRKTGDFIQGTYGVPDSEVPFIPTGFAAVGRLALPNLQPASHHYIIEAATGTAVEFGTVAPAFSQAGGGVEAFFPFGAKNQQNPRKAPSRIPDE